MIDYSIGHTKMVIFRPENDLSSLKKGKKKGKKTKLRGTEYLVYYTGLVLYHFHLLYLVQQYNRTRSRSSYFAG